MPTFANYLFSSRQNGTPQDKYFRFPSEEGYFQDIITANRWQQDQVFSDKRFAGVNPMSIRKLRLEGNLE